jgi:predicted transcriptional regulator
MQGDPTKEDERLITVVLKIDEKLYGRLDVYAKGSRERAKLLIDNAIEDYVGKREARTRRAERQKHGGHT